MANKIIKLNKTANELELVTYTSRYANSQLMYMGDLNKMSMSTYKIKPISQSDNDKYTVVRPGQQYRPDLVSMDAYGTPDFWWKIMEVNHMKDVMQFKVGTNITLPANILL